MLLAEDKGIDRAAVMNEDGVRIAAACPVECLLNDNFWWVQKLPRKVKTKNTEKEKFHIEIEILTPLFDRLHVNDKQYHVKPPARSKLTLEEQNKLGDVKSLVAQVSRTEQKMTKKTLFNFNSNQFKFRPKLIASI